MYTLMHRLVLLTVAGVLELPLVAGGVNTCRLPPKDIVLRGGVERPASRAYDGVCVAVLPPGCREFMVNGRPCAYRACLVTDNVRSCPNGDPPRFTAAGIEPCTAKPGEAGDAGGTGGDEPGIDVEAKRMAAKWTDNGRAPLSPAALTVLRNVSCQMVAFGNPEVRCIARE